MTLDDLDQLIETLIHAHGTISDLVPGQDALVVMRLTTVWAVISRLQDLRMIVAEQGTA